jgi:hypothetical protein
MFACFENHWWLFDNLRMYSDHCWLLNIHVKKCMYIVPILIQLNCAFQLSLQFVFEHFLLWQIFGNYIWNMHRNTCRSHKFMLLLSNFNQNWNALTNFGKTFQFHKYFVASFSVVSCSQMGGHNTFDRCSHTFLNTQKNGLSLEEWMLCSVLKRLHSYCQNISD